MNWTGGALGRGSRNAKTSLSVNQRRHFAKVRARFPSHRPSPKSFQHLDFPAFGKFARPRSLPHSQRSNQIKSQTSFVQDDYDDYEHQRSVPKLSTRHRDDNKRKRTSIKQEHEDEQPIYVVSTNSSPIVISSNPPSSSSSDSDEDVALPQRSIPKPPPEHESDAQRKALYLDAQRQRYLAMSDWVGLERHTKPAKIDFLDEEDRDLIGKRRRLSQRPRIYNDSHAVLQKAPRLESFLEDPRREQCYENDYLSQADISVRIGSAVDRSTRGDRAKRSVSKHSHQSPFSDEMLLDTVVPDRIEHVPGPEYIFQPSTPEPLSPLTYRHQERPLLPRPLTPSAFMDDCSPHSVEHRSVDERGLQLVADEQDDVPIEQNNSLDEQKLIPYQEVNALDGQDELLDGDPLEDFKLSKDTFLRSPSPTRLDTNPTPGSHDENLFISSSPIVRDFAYECGKTYLTPSRTYLASSRHGSDWTDTRGEDENTSSLTSLSPRNGVDPMQSIGRTEDQGDLMEDTSIQPEVRQHTFIEGTESERILDKQQPQEHVEEENTLKKTIGVSCNDLPIAVGSDTIAAEPLNQESPNANADQGADIEDAQKKEMEEEERIWRSFVFGAEDPLREWTIEEPDADTLPYYQPANTAPSMIAEAATSPLLQNAHLAEEEVRTSSPGERGKASMVAEASVSTRMQPWRNGGISDAAQQSSPRSSSILQSNQDSFEDANAPSLLAEAPSSAQDLTRGLTEPQTNQQQQHSPSSMAVQPPTTPHLTKISPAQAAPSSETDELARPPTPKQLRRRSTAPIPTVVFKKPTRYVGERSSDPLEPIHIGRRVLRNGKRMKELEEAGGGDDIVDD